MEKRFNVVFTWKHLEYKILNVYNIAYYKDFEYLVKHAIFKAIAFVNKRLSQKRGFYEATESPPCERFFKGTKNKIDIDLNVLLIKVLNFLNRNLTYKRGYYNVTKHQICSKQYRMKEKQS